MTKAEAYWILDELRKEFLSELYGEAFGIAQECIELVDLMQERNPTMTNGDRIRAMSDEELANFLHNVVRKFMCEYCKEYERIKNAKGHANCNGECDKAYLEWLKQPTEEESDDTT